MYRVKMHIELYKEGYGANESGELPFVELNRNFEVKDGYHSGAEDGWEGFEGLTQNVLRLLKKISK
jgi:hypothetical protein